MAAADRLILDRLTLRETQLHQTNDALDVKASILLVAITFIAGQSALFLHSYPKMGFTHWEQVVAVGIEFLAAIFLAWLLRTEKYPGEAAEEFSKWRDDLKKEDATQTDLVIEANMICNLVPLLTKRVARLYEGNQSKSRALNFAYWLTLTALALNFLVMLSLII